MRRTISMLLVIGVLSCSTSQPPDDSGTDQLTAVAPQCKNPSVECQYVTTHTYKDDMNHRQMAYLCAAWMAACTTTPTPINPPPPNSGGAAATGGKASTGGTPAQGGTQAGTGGATAQSQCQQLCAKEVAAGCNVDSTTCVSVCTHGQNDKRFVQNMSYQLDPSHITKAALAACGALNCK